jgi:hypothetical protein
MSRGRRLAAQITFYRDERGRPVVIGGHRRITALRQLAPQGMPGFRPDMKVQAVEVPRPSAGKAPEAREGDG